MDAPSKTNATAIVALIASLLGFTCFWGLGGLTAIVLGFTAFREIERSEGRQDGKALAGIAVGLGILSLAAMVVSAGVAIAFMARPTKPAAPLHSPVAAPLPTPRRPAPPSPPTPSESAEEKLPESSKRSTGVHEMRIGKVDFVDLNPGDGKLARGIEAQQIRARAAGEKVLLFLVSPNCHPCNGVSLSLSDALMQGALSNVRLLRVDVSDYVAELTALKIPIETVPGFALLTDDARVVDYVHGGEWGADIPANIAPVLGAFVRGKYEKRRHPFRGPTRPDETAL